MAMEALVEDSNKLVEKKASLFVKRLVDRKRESDKSPVNKVQSVQRRMSIIKAIKKNKAAAEDLNLNEPLHNEQDFLPALMNAPVKNMIDSSQWDQVYINSQVDHQSRFSVGAYFGAKSQKDLLNFYNSMDETRSELEAAEFYRRESQKFFSDRVLSAIEPEIEHQESINTTPANRRQTRDMLYLQETFSKNATQDSPTDSSFVIFDSSQVRESDNSEERWSEQRRRIDGGIYQNFEEAVNTDFYQYNAPPNTHIYDNPIVETPVRPSDKISVPTMRPTAPEFQDEHSPTMSYFEHLRPVHESTRKFYDNTTPKNLKATSDVYHPDSSEDVENHISNIQEVQTSGDKNNETYVHPPNEVFFFTNSPGRNHSSDDERLAQEESANTVEEFPLKTKAYIKKVNLEESSSTSIVSNTFNHTRSLCRTLTRRITKSFRHKINKSEKTPSVQPIPTDLNPTLKYKICDLLAKSEIEQTRIYQAAKAVEACKSSWKFTVGQERIESERLKILTLLSKQAILEEIQRLASPHVDDSLYCERGKVTLSDISLPMREDRIRLERLNNGEKEEWFIVIVCSGPIVWASQAVACPNFYSPICFSGQITIADLEPDFRITVKVYSLLLNKIVQTHEDKYGIKHLSRREKLTNVLMLKNFRDDRRANHVHDNATFIFTGSTELTLVDLKGSDSSKTLQEVQTDSLIQGKLNLKLRCELQLTIAHAGFMSYAAHPVFLTSTGHYQLTRGVDNWNRRWCVLKDQSLLFWNYPHEQEEKDSVLKVNLGICVSTQVVTADRSICPRRRTLLLETCWRHNDEGCGDSCSHIRHFFSFDTVNELTEWQSKLNHVIMSLRQWNVIKI